MYIEETMEKIADPERLAVLGQLGLLDSPAEAAFDRLTRMASLITGSPISLVSLVDIDRQFFKSAIGLPDSLTETPLSHSFCQYVVADSSPLVVEDARLHPILKDNGAVPDLNVIAYLGIPLTTSEGVDLGSFCVIDHEPRVWTEQEIEIVRELAISVMTEIELRAQITAREEVEAELRRSNKQYKRTYLFAEQTLIHMENTIDRGAEPAEIRVYLKSMKDDLTKLK